ncbi:MAG: hypothetical protein K6F69_09915, partial [Treponema sp.]|nr:hypothetical protein [Treponema sp.]
MKKVCLYTVFIFVFSLFYAQSLSTNSALKNTSTIDSSILEIDDFLADYVSRGWTASDGLPGNTITDLVQDNLGYLYIGTYEGLVRFDGLEFTIYNKNHDKRYPFVSARKIFQSSKGDLWVGSNDEGICCISQDTSIPVKSFTTKDGLPNNSIRAITEDKNGNVWVGTAGGIVYITPDGKIVVPDKAGLLAFDDENCLCTHLYCDTVGRIWLATSKKNGIYYYLDGRFTNYANKLKFDKDVYVTTIAQDNTDVFWFGLAPHYAVRIDEKGSKTFDLSYKPSLVNERHIVPTSTIINCIYQDKNGTLWFATDGGLVIYRNGRFLHYSENEGLVDNNVNRLIEDREGNIWIATDRGGVQKMNKGRFKTINLPSSVNA